jgi:hypothetical protein
LDIKKIILIFAKYFENGIKISSLKKNKKKDLRIKNKCLIFAKYFGNEV